jgi:hypothetical protein
MEEKVDKIYVSVEKTRRYFMWTLIISIAVIVLPLIGLLITIPMYLNNLKTGLMGL